MPLLDKDDVLAHCAGQWPNLYGIFTDLHQEGNEFVGTCPIHQGSHPNFKVNPDSGQWYCHSQCQEGGDALTFLEKKEGLRFGDALMRLAEIVGMPVPDAGARSGFVPTRKSPAPIAPPAPPVLLDKNLAQQAHSRLMNSQNQKMRDWLLKNRGWTEDTLVRFQLGLDQRAEDKAAGVYRVTFPVFDAAGQLTNLRRHLFAYKDDITEERRRELGKSKPWQKGLTPGLFPVSSLEGASDVLLVGGEPDAVLANQLGIPAVTGTSGEGTWKPEWTEALAGRCVTVLYDNDEAGEAGARKVSAALHAGGVCVSVAQYPEGVKDLTEWVVMQRASVADLNRIIKEAVPVVSDLPVLSFPQSTRPVNEWPDLPVDALHGLAGDIVRAIDPHTEADPAALLVQFLTGFGSCVGNGPYLMADGGRHGGNLFAVMVGVSSKGRKGTSWNRVRPLFESVAPDWAARRVLSGLSSGEGLIHAVRDPLEKQEKNKKTGEMETVLVDAGVEDKRLLVMESEFASVLRQTQRDGNTLSTTIRSAWDTGSLQSMTKNSPSQATGAHISIVGHITAGELRKDLAETETANGFGNRFLWVCVKRSKELPFGGDENALAAALAPLLPRLQDARDHVPTVGELTLEGVAREIWLAVYHDLSSGKPGLLGAMTGRSEAQVMRLALLYALLDCDTAIRADHLTAALALWEYCEASARYIFGDSLGDRVADDILRALREAREGITRTEISRLFQKHQSTDRIGQALTLLAEHGHIRTERQDTGGRPIERYFAV